MTSTTVGTSVVEIFHNGSAPSRLKGKTFLMEASASNTATIFYSMRGQDNVATSGTNKGFELSPGDVVTTTDYHTMSLLHVYGISTQANQIVTTEIF